MTRGGGGFGGEIEKLFQVLHFLHPAAALLLLLLTIVAVLARYGRRDYLERRVAIPHNFGRRHDFRRGGQRQQQVGGRSIKHELLLLCVLYQILSSYIELS
jgi:hypothetical protein